MTVSAPALLQRYRSVRPHDPFGMCVCTPWRFGSFSTLILCFSWDGEWREGRILGMATFRSEGGRGQITTEPWLSQREPLGTNTTTTLARRILGPSPMALSFGGARGRWVASGTLAMWSLDLTESVSHGRGGNGEWPGKNQDLQASEKHSMGWRREAVLDVYCQLYDSSGFHSLPRRFLFVPVSTQFERYARLLRLPPCQQRSISMSALLTTSYKASNA